MNQEDKLNHLFSNIEETFQHASMQAIKELAEMSGVEDLTLNDDLFKRVEEKGYKLVLFRELEPVGNIYILEKGGNFHYGKFVYFKEENVITSDVETVTELPENRQGVYQ